jgi:Hydrazine synthase alpha subunit middle domain/WD40-like Beta Propeller Repeat
MVPAIICAQDTLVLTQAPRKPASDSPKCFVDACYPAGTRIVVSKAPFAADHVVVLSDGLLAAGGPVMAYDGRQVVFAAKHKPDSEWQIYVANLTGGRPHVLTTVPGGAAHPALLPDGNIVFAFPASAAIGLGSPPAPQLCIQPRQGTPRQLTFAPGGANDPVLLPDGRILFVSSQPAETHRAQGSLPGSALYTINNDGTEITAFACQHDSPALLHNPTLLNDGRVAFLAADGTDVKNGSCNTCTAETVRMARPFASRAGLFASQDKTTNGTKPAVRVRSVQPAGQSNLLICAESPAGPNAEDSCACYRVSGDALSLGTPLFIDAAWNTIEAIEAVAPKRPMGRLSNMDATKRTGQILCLDVNDTTVPAPTGKQVKATRVRLLAGSTAQIQALSGKKASARDIQAMSVLGEVDVQADGSFMAEVPADVPLGFEALDEQGQVIRREPPSIWVRSGENRSCVGCHAAHNRAPHNHRPLAVRVPVPRFCEVPQANLAVRGGK